MIKLALGFNSPSIPQQVSEDDVVRALQKIVRLYPEELKMHQLMDIPRIAFNITVSIPPKRAIKDLTICDIGGGIGLFSLGCAAIGFGKVILVDDFEDQINQQVQEMIFAIHRSMGVKVIKKSVMCAGLTEVGETLDVVTSFDSMEHWHHSPKRLFHEILEMLSPAGLFVLGVPNCVNLRKRITVPLGYGKWCSMQDWYEPTVFRGHVREPDQNDLFYIAGDLGLVDVRILGRNWLGYANRNRIIQIATRFADRLMRLRPSICSDLYLIGRKPGRYNETSVSVM